MKIIEKISEMQAISLNLKKYNKTVAIVPTMGFLHSGHLSLIEYAKQKADVVVTTLFVNPKQFAPHEDFDKYPRNIENDSKLAQESGSDFLFHPGILEMYPKGYSTSVKVESISQPFEGDFRPHFFEGVATVVAKLFNAVLPDIAVFGQKDYQQYLVIYRMIRDMNFPINLFLAPTLREADGLAMSSRNVYLNREERDSAAIIFVALENAKTAIAMGARERKIINAMMHKTLRENPSIRIDYAASAVADTLDTPDEFLPGDKVVLLIAVYIGKTRLIDNSLTQIPTVLDKDPAAFLEDSTI